MRVTITSSSSSDINEDYLTESQKVIEYLAGQGYDLNWGSSSSSIMGLCYKTFDKYNRNIYGYTTPKYLDDLENLPHAKIKVLDNTFDMKKELFNDADLIVCLPGGLGTISELYSYIEEIRSNDKKTELILYNINHYYDIVLTTLNHLIEEKFASSNILDYFKVVNNCEDFIKTIEDNN